jgi:oligopeptide/dipeptide ABC transporter ATP-binding protein
MSNQSLDELLYVKNLKTYFYTQRGTIKAVDGVSFKIYKGKALGLIGETGSGKTTVGFSIIRLIPYLFKTESGFFKVLVKPISSGEIVDGEIIYKGRDLLKLSEEEMRELRGKEISMIFQNPIDAMHPMKTIGFQTGEPKEVHEKERWEKIREVVFDYLGKVELREAKKRYYHDPHRFSGGEGQRIMIAMALICNPYLLIADEPTSSLDVVVQRQVLELIKRLKKEFDLSMLLMTHDLGVVAEMSDQVGVMYAGKFMEYGDVKTIFKKPKHPYTRGLLSATPSIYSNSFRFEGIPGSPPDPYNLPKGCRFHPRCKYAKEICTKKQPETIEIEQGHFVACSRAYEIQ